LRPKTPATFIPAPEDRDEAAAETRLAQEAAGAAQGQAGREAYRAAAAVTRKDELPEVN
jgi:hypothetical protein